MNVLFYLTCLAFFAYVSSFNWSDSPPLLGAFSEQTTFPQSGEGLRND